MIVLQSLFAMLNGTGELAGSLDVDAVSRVMLALLQGLILQQAWEPELDIEAYVTTAVGLIGAALSGTKPGIHRRNRLERSDPVRATYRFQIHPEVHKRS